jgi:hypothetical protein
MPKNPAKPPLHTLLAQHLAAAPASSPAPTPIVITVATGATLNLTVALPGQPPDRP